MKSIKEKARAYDEAIKKLHEIITMDNKPVTPKEMGEFLFPELKESEGERIRKELVAYCQVNMGHIWHNIKQEDYIAWLEKQGKQKSIDSLTQQEAMDIAVAKCFNDQKPADNVEPKFHEGEWITRYRMVKRL